MPLYRFIVHKSRRGADSDSTEVLPDDAAALKEASKIIHDLTKNNPARSSWNGWKIEVIEGNRQACEISFHGAN
jgi:Domain of unknown function (DUF6894)